MIFFIIIKYLKNKKKKSFNKSWFSNNKKLGRYAVWKISIRKIPFSEKYIFQKWLLKFKLNK